MPPPSRGDEAAGAIRRLLLVLLVVGIPGIALELLLLEHWEEWQQWLPFVVLGAGWTATIAVLWRPGGRTIRLFRVVMALFVATGLLGLWLHYSGNRAFELEMDASLEGVELFRKAIMGATPAMAPATMAYMGLLGLIAVWRHPAGSRPGSDARADQDRPPRRVEV